MNQRRDADDAAWDGAMERIDREVGAEDLAAAERALREAGAAEVAPVSPEWIETTVARVTRGVETPPTVRRGGWWSGVQRLAAAVLAFASMHATATAATVGVVVTTAVVVSVLWPGMADSDRTMPFQVALEVLDSPTEPEEAKAAAMFEVARHLGAAVKLLAAARDGDLHAGQPSIEARRALESLSALLHGGDSSPVLSRRDGDFDALLEGVRNGAAASYEMLGQASLAGIRALQGVTQPALREHRERYLDRLRSVLPR